MGNPNFSSVKKELGAFIEFVRFRGRKCREHLQYIYHIFLLMLERCIVYRDLVTQSGALYLILVHIFMLAFFLNLFFQRIFFQCRCDWMCRKRLVEAKQVGFLL